jgi:hypothetical protein
MGVCIPAPKTAGRAFAHVPLADEGILDPTVANITTTTPAINPGFTILRYKRLDSSENFISQD